MKQINEEIKPLQDIKLIIFDLDGTLVNSLPDLSDAVNYTLSKLGEKTISQEQVATFIGGGLKKLLKLATGNIEDEYYEKARSIFMEYYDKNYINKTTVFDGVDEMLSHFSTKKKVLFSNKLHLYTIATAEKLMLDHFFVKILGAQPHVFKSKPSPEGIVIILEELNINPKNALMVGDSTHDIQAGKAAGLYTCAVTYGYRSKDILLAAKPDIIIDDIRKLKQHIT